MGNQIVLTVIVLIAIALLLVFNELNYRRLSIKGEITRKFAHFTATLSTIVFPYIFTSHWYVLILAFVFFVILFVSRKGTQLKSIHDINRKSVGSYLLPISIYFTFLISDMLDNKFLFILPMLVLAICDPVAGILGLNLKKGNHKISFANVETGKTYIGSGSFFVSCLIISIIALYYNRVSFDIKTFWLATVIALVSTLAELVSFRGTDNLTIPMSVLIVLVLFL